MTLQVERKGLFGDLRERVRHFVRSAVSRQERDARSGMARRAAEREALDGGGMRGVRHEQTAREHLLRMDHAVREVAVGRDLHRREVLGSDDRALDDAVAEVG